MSSSKHDPSHLARDQLRAAEAEVARQKAALEDAEREVAVFLAVSQALTAWGSFEQDVGRLLRDLAGALGLTAGALWLPQDDVLIARTIWTVPSVDRMALERALRPLRLPRGIGAPGCAWERREPIQQAISAAHDCFPRRESTLSGLGATVALPALVGDEMLGVVELYSASHAKFSTRLMQVLTAAGYVLGAFFARRRFELKLSPITTRELEVLTLAAQGLIGRKIADQLSISPATVKTHFEHIHRKLGVSDRAAAVAYALRAGLIE
jgi:DNA-binding CsgD family transcriptional regulator